MGDALHGVVLWRKADIKLTASTTTSLTTVSAGTKGHEYSNSSCTRKRKEKTSSLPAAGPSKKKQKTVERKLSYEKNAEELEEDTARYIKE